VKRAVTAVVAAALLGACGSDGDDDDVGDNPTTAETNVETIAPAPAPDKAVFREDDVGFTFEYPKDYVREQPAGTLGQVSPERGQVFNAIKVREAADRELQPERYLEDFKRDFERRVGTVERRMETFGDVEAGVLEFEDSHRKKGEDPVEFTSTSYFFTGAGRTWQVECVAESGRQEEIDSACEAALESIRWRQDA
jgi:hypothetical protein